MPAFARPHGRSAVSRRSRSSSGELGSSNEDRGKRISGAGAARAPKYGRGSFATDALNAPIIATAAPAIENGLTNDVMASQVTPSNGVTKHERQPPSNVAKASAVVLAGIVHELDDDVKRLRAASTRNPSPSDAARTMKPVDDHSWISATNVIKNAGIPATSHTIQNRRQTGSLGGLLVSSSQSSLKAFDGSRTGRSRRTLLTYMAHGMLRKRTSAAYLHAEPRNQALGCHAFLPCATQRANHRRNGRQAEHQGGLRAPIRVEPLAAVPLRARDAPASTSSRTSARGASVTLSSATITPGSGGTSISDSEPLRASKLCPV